MIHRALQHIHETRTSAPAAPHQHNIGTRNNSSSTQRPTATSICSHGDLLMHVPCKYTWSELKDLAKNRKAWQQRVSTIKQGPRFTVKLRPASAISKTSIPNANITPVSPPVTIKSSCKQDPDPAQKYRSRDEHELFFRTPQKGRKQAPSDKT